MQSDLPKQFMLLLDSPVLMHTLERFAMTYEDIAIVLVLPEDQISLWTNMCQQMDFDVPHTVVAGGDTRYASVKNGLAKCADEGIVGIHDGVRPLISPVLIERCYDAALEHGSALPVLPVTQSLRKLEGTSSTPISREGVVSVQTPQCFDLAEIKKCYDASYDPSFTDDATVYEKAGNTIHLIEGEASNLKITTPGDMQMAEALLSPGKKTKR